MGCVPPAPGFLEGLRRVCDQYGSLLILDEVMTGFRVAYGGAQQRYGIRPDLTTIGKVIGGGLPIAAYGGRRDIMSRVAPVGPDLPGGHAVRESPRGRRGTGDAAGAEGASRSLRPARTAGSGALRGVPAG